jgi:1-deoxy-D-xylulose-5-phosphate reductoisomerase
LTFEKPDHKKFPALKLALRVSALGGTCPAVLNAADEIAVRAFLEKQIRFDQIYHVLEKVVRGHSRVIDPTLTDIKQADLWAREKAQIIIKGIR